MAYHILSADMPSNPEHKGARFALVWRNHPQSVAATLICARNVS